MIFYHLCFITHILSNNKKELFLNLTKNESSVPLNDNLIEAFQ